MNYLFKPEFRLVYIGALIQIIYAECATTFFNSLYYWLWSAPPTLVCILFPWYANVSHISSLHLAVFSGRLGWTRGRKHAMAYWKTSVSYLLHVMRRIGWMQPGFNYLKCVLLNTNSFTAHNQYCGIRFKGVFSWFLTWILVWRPSDKRT